MYKKMNKYFSKHVTFTSLVHAVGGMGVGILIASPVAQTHPVRWGVALFMISVLGHLYAAQAKN